MARKAVRIGWLPRVSRASSSMLALPDQMRVLARATARGSELSKNPVDQFRAWCRCIVVLVVEAHRLPLEGTHLMKWLDLNPFHVLHRRHEACDTLDVGRIVS